MWNASFVLACYYYCYVQAYSIAPLLVYPTHYTGEAGYVSDTESSEIVPDIVKNAFPSSKESKPDKGSKEIDVDKIKVDLLPAPEADTTTAAAAAASQIEDIGSIGNEFHSEL